MTNSHKRGRLKIFLGAAAGVGKTWKMLDEARQRKEQGADVVAGLVVNHGREDIIRMAEGFETVPPRKITYRESEFEEMDTDAVVGRKPQLALIDELAHTDVPGSVHEKRYQDIDDVLDAGIDVYTTVNIQHLESLNDQIAQITGVRIRETFPDDFLRKADDLLLVDITPEDLRARMEEGKVYEPEKAEQALENFFKTRNLTALRELALREAAYDVDEQMEAEAAAAAPGTAAVGERLLVAVGANDNAQALIRRGWRAARRLRADLNVMYVQMEGRALSELEEEIIAAVRKLTASLGGHFHHVTGRDVAEEVLRFSRENGVTQVFVGRSRRRWWRQMLGGSVMGRLMQEELAVDIHVIGNPAGDTEV